MTTVPAAIDEDDIVRSNPIKEGLDPFRRSFNSRLVDLNVAASPDAVQTVLSTPGSTVAKNLLLDLIIILQIQPAARILPSRNSSGTLLRDLASYITLLDSNNFNIESAIPLVERVVENAPDVEIWRAVSDLIAPLSQRRSTPPTAFAKEAFDTPLRSNSASQTGSEQTHDDVDQRIVEELIGRVYDNVEGFYERHFEGKGWSENARDVYKKCRAPRKGNHWSGWPIPPLEVPFLKWFAKFQATIFSGLCCHRYYTSANKVLRGSDARRKLDIFLAPANAVFGDSEHDWSSVLVIGEHKSNSNEDGAKATLVQIAGYAREVFGSQPDRRFVPGFTICGSLMRLWLFDRSGAYSSKKFDIHKKPEQFVNVLAGYALMTDAELGLNTFIKRNSNGKHIIAGDVRISLEDKPIASTKAIVSRGTTCYRGRRSDSIEWEYVVKFAWPSNKIQGEGDLLKLAKERGVKGIAEWFYHEQITIDSAPDTIAHFRRGMKFRAPRKLSSKTTFDDAESSWMYAEGLGVGSTKSSAAHLKALGTSTSSYTTLSSGQKRKRNEDVDGDSGKRSKLTESRSSVADMEIPVDAEKREPDITGHHSIQEAEPSSLADWESETYDNRIHCCLVVSPAGRPLHAYRSVGELLEALRDALLGHKSLYEDGKILHRDISENNVIIVEAANKGDSKGILIDLDMAKKLASPPSGASHRTGTMQFMAIGVLQGRIHTYRHDLESFFYVLIWMFIRYGSEDFKETSGPPQPTSKTKKTPISTSRLRRWYTGTYAEIAETKLAHMDKKQFEQIVAEFAPRFENQKQLARGLRSVLFPIRDGALFTGAFADKDIMYDGMINAFDLAIDRIRNEEQAIA